MMNGYVIYNKYIMYVAYGYVIYIIKYVWWMGMLYIINYVWWMGMLYIIIVYDEWICYIY